LKRYLSLKIKMALTVFVLILGTLSVFGLLALHHLEKEHREGIARQQMALTKEIAEQIDGDLTRAREIMVQTAGSIPLEMLGDTEALQRFLDTRLGLGTRHIFDNGVFLFSAEGILLAESPYIDGRRGKDYSWRDYFRKTLAAKAPTISDPYISSQKHRHPAVNFTAPVKNPAGEIVAVLSGSIDLQGDNFLGRLTRTRIGEEGYFFLYNPGRLMILHPDPTRIMQHDVPVGANLLFDRAIDGFEGTGDTVNSRGLKVMATFKHLQEADWILAANYPAAEAMAPILRMKKFMVIGLILVLAACTLCVWLSMRYLTWPLQHLCADLKRSTEESGERDPLPVRNNDEIGQLTVLYNRLMEEIENEKKQSRQRLQFLQTVIDTIPNPVYYKDLQGRYLGCNLAFEEVHGRSRRELFGKTVEEIAAPEAAEQIAAADRQLYAQQVGEFQIYEQPMTFADARRHDVLFYKAVFHDENGAPAGLVGSMIDITPRKAAETALADAKDFSENLLENSAVPCFVLDTDHRVILWTRACEELTGIRAEDVVGTDRHWQAFYDHRRPCLADLIIDGNLEGTLDLYDRFANSLLIPEGLQSEDWFPAIGGRSRYLFFEAAPIRDRKGRLVAAIETLHDLTASKHAELALTESEASNRSLIERSPDAILVHRKGEVIFGNPVATRLFGAEKAEQLRGQKVVDLVHPDNRDAVQKRIAATEIDHTEGPYIEERILRLDGTVVDVEAGSSPVFYGSQWAVQTVLRDITERKQLQERIWHQANFDALTGLPNRSLFQDRLQQAINRSEREGKPLALMFIDLDRFKEINDSLGHEAGDVLLQQVAHRLNGTLRKSDTVARMGGDEFTVILAECHSQEDIEGVARQILQKLEQPFDLPGGQGTISATIGIALYPDDGCDSSELMKNADVAMYRAKKQGRNGFAFHREERVFLRDSK
jgi:two-component system NtrC family sensor kinase